MKTRRIINALVLLCVLIATPAMSATIYDPGAAPTAASSGLTFGTHLLSGPHASVVGIGGGGLNATGSILDGQRTYIYDLGAATDLGDGVARRTDSGFAMMIWDFGRSYDSLRLYTHQDHYTEAFGAFWAQDMMEYSVWGSKDGDNFLLLSDVLGWSGTNKSDVTYMFAGTAPSIVYRGGSAEYGLTNAFTREYVFGTDYQYYGIRTSRLSLANNDADPELDAIAAFNISNRPPGTPGTKVPEPGTLMLLASGLAGLMALKRKMK